MLKEVMEELRLQEQELARIREEEHEIEALLRRSGGGRGPRGGGRERSYGGGGLPGGAAYGGDRHASPRHQPNQQPSPRDYGEQTRASGGWQPPSFMSGGATQPPAGAGSYGVGLRGRKAEQSIRADPSSVHYDPRADPNSRYYDPELDPNSKWFNGGGASSMNFNGSSGSQSARVPQPPSGSAWNGAAYGVPPRSAGSERPPHGSPPRRNGGAGGGGRSSRRGNKSGVVTAHSQSSSAMTAVSALAATSNPTDIGSLYYVLGSQASSSRVKQLQKMLELRRDAEQRQQQEG